MAGDLAGNLIDDQIDAFARLRLQHSIDPTGIAGVYRQISAEFNFDLHAARRIDYVGVTFRTRTIEEIREIFDKVHKDLWGAVESRKLQLPIDKVFAFDDIGKAFEHMEANRHLGKIVVTL